ncbi:MAG TPA: SCO family protein [Candidatus Binatia bacterium]|jgi:cytochrome oxidase Cu insertion factor (SCO1/SenC/PrrC family)
MTHRGLHYILTALLLGVLLGGALLVARAKKTQSEAMPLEGLRDFGAVPDFALVERSGKPVTLSSLKGKIWLADFIYTVCEDTCPLETAAMAQLQNDLKSDGVRLVSFSVDPERDTPAVLTRYAELFHADPTRWLFVTGKKNAVYRLVQDGFHLSAIPIADDSPHIDGAVFHDAHFVLVDGSARIRGYYESNDAAALKRLTADAKKLLAENG